MLTMGTSPLILLCMPNLFKNKTPTVHRELSEHGHMRNEYLLEHKKLKRTMMFAHGELDEVKC